MTFISTKTLSQRFWEKVDKSGDCWEWTAQLNDAGYGCFKLDKRHQLAHRVSFKIANGYLPEDLFICHTCDNPRCVKPAHLFAATHKVNMADMVQKHRHVSANAAKSRCKHGHAFTPENTYYTNRGWRKCKQCTDASNRKSMLKTQLACNGI